jgi:hypothetical protein
VIGHRDPGLLGAGDVLRDDRVVVGDGVLSVFTGLARGVSVAALRLTLAMTMGRLFASCVATLRAP